MHRFSNRLFLLTFTCLVFIPATVFAASPEKRAILHDMNVELHLEAQKLVAHQRLRLAEAQQRDWPKRLRLAAQTDIRQVSADGAPLDYSFRSGWLDIPEVPPATAEVSIEYQAVFDDQVPQQTAGIEDPSYGVAATITRDGAFLSGSVHWTASAPGWQNSYLFRVIGPRGLVGVTDGRFLSTKTEGDRTITTWQSGRLEDSPTLAAGYYDVERADLDNIQVLTFFTPENSGLTERYLSASREYLELYQDLFGPYPYEKFAVVENFFPTGYGLPGWTLLGSTVIRLPFIINTSLPHEIVHAWWGNAVEVDYGTGNWCEGLATYVADYLLKERSSTAEAHEYRLKLLRDYATLVDEQNDFPLREFRRRTSKSEQAVGYGKTAMVFHMLRQKLGDKQFWAALQRLAAEGEGKRLGWNDLEETFSAVAEQDLDAFFKQWVDRPGAPALAIEDLKRVPTEQGWEVSGTIVQSGTALYELDLPVIVQTEQREHHQKLAIATRETPFHFRTQARPLKIVADPAHDIFRRLAPAEIPVTVNALRAAQNKLIVLAESAPDELLAASENLVRGLQWFAAPVVREQRLTTAQENNNQLLIIGAPTSARLRAFTSELISIARHEFRVGDTIFGSESDALFFVTNMPEQADGAIGIFLPLSIEAAGLVARKIPHYGRYSYLVFKDGQNVIKGTWFPDETPLSISFEEPR